MPGQSVFGMLPDQDAASLPPNQARELLNFRPRSGALVVRPGATRLMDPPVPGAAYRGSWHGVFEKERSTFVAYRIPGTPAKTAIYRLQDGLDSAGEITTETTRFTEEGYVAFAVIRDIDPENSADLLVMGNGEDANFVYSKATEHAYLAPGIASNVKVEPPGKATRMAGPEAWVMAFTANPASDPAKVGFNNISGALNIFIPAGQDPGGVTAVAGITSTRWDGTNGFALTNHLLVQYFRSFTTGIDIPDADAWPAIESIELYGSRDGAGMDWHEVYGPASYGAPPQITVNAERGYVRRTIPTDGLNLEGITQVRFTFAAGIDPLLSRQIEIGGFATSGPVAGETEYAVAYADSPGRGESLPVVCEPVRARATSWTVGLYGEYSVWSGALGSWPEELPSRFACSVTIPDVWATASPLRQQWLVLYRSEAFVENGVISFGDYFRVGWEEVAPGFAEGTRVRIVDKAPYPADSDFEAPDGLYVASPKSASLVGESARLFACESSLLWCGDAQHPLRFRRLPRVTNGAIDESSALALSFAGEAACAVRGMGAATGANGLSPLAMFTDRSAYRVAGANASDLSRPQRIAGARGAFDARAVTVEGGSVFWVDPEGRLNATDGAGSADLSTGRCKAWTARRLAPGISLDVWDGIVRLLLPGGRFLGFDTGTRGFLSDQGPVYVGTLHEFDRWLGWDEEGALWRLEDPAATVDGHEPIAASVSFREVMGAELGRTTFDRVGLWATRGGASDWTVRWEEPTFGEVQSGVIPSDTGDPGIAKWTNPRAVAGQSVQITVSGAFESGVSLRGVFLEANPSAGRRA
ncbi:hypothetical protein EON81_16725 [bacterium]|nr:MAG: hypothetical protein EON81_16725 [bacterium]